jgi:HSP20 family protein
MNRSHLLPNLWASFDQLQSEMDRLLEGWGVDLPRSGVQVFPPVNVWEDADAFYLEAELPGLSRDQLQISVTHRNHLTLQGERAGFEPEKGRWHRRERGFGRSSASSSCRRRWTPTRWRRSWRTASCT